MKKTENPCGYTVGAGVGATISELGVWQRTARRQAEATHRAAAMAEALVMIWEKLTPEERERIEGDSVIRERLRTVTGYYGFNCS